MIHSILLIHNPLSLSPASWLSAIIRLFIRFPFQHLEFLVEIGGKKFVVGAVFLKVKIRPYEEWLRKQTRTIVYAHPEVPYTEADFNRLMSFVGKRYDIASLLHQAWYILTGRWTGRVSKSDESVNCSELYGQVFRDRHPENYYKLTTSDIIKTVAVERVIHARRY